MVIRERFFVLKLKNKLKNTIKLKRMKKFNLIVAYDSKRGIGKDGDLPWRLPSDLKRFGNLTKTTVSPNGFNAVIMGRKTYDSLPNKYKPLPNRLNVVISTTRKDLWPDSDSIRVANSFDKALEICKGNKRVETVWVVGGSEIYKMSLDLRYRNDIGAVYTTEIQGDFSCDTFFPQLVGKWNQVPSQVYSENGISFKFVKYFL